MTCFFIFVFAQVKHSGCIFITDTFSGFVDMTLSENRHFWQEQDKDTNIISISFDSYRGPAAPYKIVDMLSCINQVIQEKRTKSRKIALEFGCADLPIKYPSKNIIVNIYFDYTASWCLIIRMTAKTALF
jgi:hypothetical protein